MVVIENPILNSPFLEPKRHFRFSDEGITNEIINERRISSYFVPIPRAKKKGKAQLAFDTEWTQDRVEENKFINRVRARVALWRQGGYIGITKTTRQLLDYWRDPVREKRLFFCQIEALETAIYIAEVADKYGDGWIRNELRTFSDESNPHLGMRMAFKMATGSGKTVVMAMLIAWHTLNKLANTQDARFSDAFLIVTPGITIRDRLRVLLPNDPGNYYRERDIVPSEWLTELGKAKILVINYHGFKPRQKGDASTLTKNILRAGAAIDPFVETPDEMVRRVCRELGTKKNIVVINDEAHHCYRRRAASEDDDLKGDERKEAEKRNEEARVWISGLEAVKAKIGVRMVYDLSATPFFLRGSGYTEGTLFQWVVSDFSLIDAIEGGIVKIPRVPVSDNAMVDDLPTYRNLWLRIGQHLPRKGRKTDDLRGEPQLPAELEGALQSLYINYEKYYQQWHARERDDSSRSTPPVFIVVCNNTNVSKLVFDYIAGWEKTLADGVTIAVPGQLALFSNESNGEWSAQPNTILVDSEQLESGDALSADFKKLAAREIEEFKAEYRARFPGRSTDDLTDEDLLREVMNTVGKFGKLGEHIRCVVSVSMLTEGWDANTVTHILGVRAFGTQLLCEQVVGRALRRVNYVPDDRGMFAPEYAEVYGVPFSFIPSAGAITSPIPTIAPTRVYALENRVACEITFPRITGYRYEITAERLTASFGPGTMITLSTSDIPTRVENAPIVGETTVHTLDDLKRHREQEIAFLLAKLTLETYFRDEEKHIKFWFFPQLLSIAREWLRECVVCKDDTFPQLLLFIEPARDAAEKIYHALVAGEQGNKRLKPILRPFDTLGSTRYVDFDTAKPTYRTDPSKCQISHVVADTKIWEQKMAQVLEEMPEVVAYVKNQGLGFTIPYTLSGEEHQYIPDFIVRLDDGHGRDDLLNLIVETSGEPIKEKAAKVTTARTLWIPAVNNDGTFGRWSFIEITDPWEAKSTIRAILNGVAVPS
ncbi:MAG: BPTD_3080 family restriction endonuclease [Thermomicrobiales bacterium]